MAVSEVQVAAGPRQFDLDRCVHCGLCLNACPTYRELGLEMDSPRGRVYQMVQAASGAVPIGPSYIQHLELCLACRACETACPSGVQYGRLIEAARAQIEAAKRRPLPVRLFRRFLFDHLLVSPRTMRWAGNLLYFYQVSGLRKLARFTGLLGALEPLTPPAERPFFFRNVGQSFAAEGPQRYRVAFLAGCIANVCFARLNEATVRVLQRNGCEVEIPAGQTCCGALHLHSGLREAARRLARRNIDALLAADCDTVLTNAAGCGSTLKEYGELLADDPAYAARAARFSSLVKDVTEFLASIELNREMRPLGATVTYQDSCHLAHGQRVRLAPRKLLQAVPGLEYREMPLSDLCCGSAGIYNVVQREMAGAILRQKMECINSTGAEIVATANPGCILELRAGVALYGRGQRVKHVVEILDEAYSVVE
jgi:glycolate oxidase iron-sulfur subunit